MRSSGLCIAMCALLLAAGCQLEEKMVWSPDGTRAAVRLPHGLCLMATNGVVSPPVASNVVAVAWLPDSGSLMVLREIPVPTWQDAARLLPPEETATVEALTRGMVDVVRGALAAANGDASAVTEKFFKPLDIQSANKVLPILLCLHDTQTLALRKMIRGARNTGDWEKFMSESVKLSVNELSILPLAADRMTGTPTILERTLDDLSDPRPSPTTPVVAFLRRDVLTVAPLNGVTNRICVAEKVTGSFDWTADGKSLVYPVRLTEKWELSAINLVRIERRGVADAAGAPAPGPALPLALASVAFTPRVRCLPEGQVLFASLALQLPAPAEMAQEARLFLIDPAHGTNSAPVAIPSPSGTLPTDLAGFVPSPDGRRIAIVEYGSDVVTVLDRVSGSVEVISPKRNGKSRTLPAWRGTNELYFAALPQTNSTRSEWMRWSKGSAPQVISQQWKDESVKGLIEYDR